MGAAAVISNAIGEGDTERVQRLTTHSLVLSVTIVVVVAALTNVVCDPILIFGWGPIPNLGIEAAATAMAATALNGMLRPFHAAMLSVIQMFVRGVPLSWLGAGWGGLAGMFWA